MDKKLILVIGIGAVIILAGLLFFAAKSKPATVTPTQITTPGTSPTLVIFLEPANVEFSVGETKTLTLKAKVNGNLSEPLTHFTTEISFPNKILQIPKNHYVDTSLSPFSKIVRVDGPRVANDAGTVTIDLEAQSASPVKMTKDQVLTLARIDFNATTTSTTTLAVTVGKTEITTNQSQQIPVVVQGTQFTVKP